MIANDPVKINETGIRKFNKITNDPKLNEKMEYIALIPNDQKTKELKSKIEDKLLIELISII